jgi:hypothetical protein
MTLDPISFVADSAQVKADRMRRGDIGGFRGSLRRVVAFLEKFARRRPLGFAVTLVTLLFAAVIWLMPPAFQTNDDAIMSMIVSGQGIALQPDEHLVFTNVVIGKILKALYSVFPEIHWYGWYLIATQWLATIVILYCLIRPRYTRLCLVGFGAYFGTAGIYFIVNLQFTAVGILLAIAGGFLLLQLLRGSGNSFSKQIVLALGAVFCLVWGGMVRSEIFPLALLIICPILVVSWACSASFSAALKVGLTLAGACGAMLLAERYHQYCYSDPIWKEFYEYNPLRIKFNDEKWVKYLPETQHVFEQVGWTKIDVEMIREWYYDDPQYNKESLNRILSSYSWAQERDLTTTLSTTLRHIIRQQAIYSLIIVMLPLLCFLKGQPSRLWAFVVALVLAWGIVVAITLLRKEPPERVYIPVLSYPWLVLLYVLSPGWRGAALQRGAFSWLWQRSITPWHVRHWSWLKPQAGRYFALRTISLVVIGGFVMNFQKQYRLGSWNVERMIQYHQMLDDMRPGAGESERLIVAFGSDFPYEQQAVLFGKNDYSGLRFYSVGWLQRTPIAEQTKQYFQIKNLGQAIATNLHLKLVLERSCYARLLEYLAVHYDSSLQIVSEKEYFKYSLSSIKKRKSEQVAEPTQDSLTRLAFPYLQRLGLIR